MIFASTTDMIAQLTDDLDVNPCVAASLLDSLLCDDEDEAL